MTHRDGFSPEVGGLGRKVERPKPEPAKPVLIKPGIVRNPDGKWSTDIPPPSPFTTPLPTITPDSCWLFPVDVAELLAAQALDKRPAGM